ncbi:MAG: VanZ family protein [Clostridia bacterium]|nr:VanZ family protein [Clostridia bacterium]
MKTLSKILYVTYSIFVILILVLDTGVASAAINVTRDILNGNKEITDVSIQLDETELLAGKYYYPEYTPIGDFGDDAGLVYESIDPEHLKVSANGAVCAPITFEGDSFDASVRITSKYDSNFEKVVSFHFIKKYPELFTATYYLKGYGYTPKTLYIGVPVYIYSGVSSNNPPYNVRDYEVVYDENYFDKADDGSLIPKRVTADGEKLSFTVRYANGATNVSKSFEIKEQDTQAAQIDEIRINNTVGDTIDLVRGASLSFTMYSNGKLVASDYSLTFEDESDVTMNAAGQYAFNTSGDKTVTVTLPNGYSKTFTVKVRNVISAPTLTDEDVSASRHVTVLDTDVRTVNFAFSEGVTYTTIEYEYDENVIKVIPSSKSFRIVPIREGVTELRLVVDDGITRAEESLTVEVKKNTSLRVALAKSVPYWLPKIVGHGGLFMILAFFAMLMFYHLDVDSSFARFLLYTLSGLSVAFISEFAQMFMPSRSASMIDVLIDMSGFLVGTLLVLLSRSIRGK